MEGHVNTHQQRPPFDEAEGGVPEGLTLAERARAARDRLPASLPAAGPDLPSRGEALIRVDGEEHRISWEEIREVE